MNGLPPDENSPLMPKRSTEFSDSTYPQPCPRGHASTPRSHNFPHNTDRPVVTRASVSLPAPDVRPGSTRSPTTGTVKTMTRNREDAIQNDFLPVHLETRAKTHRAAIHVARPKPIAVRHKKANVRATSRADCPRPAERFNERRT